MKTITLTQPWATLIAIGAKKIETRSWSTNYRGSLAIHAAKGLAGMTHEHMLDLCTSDPFWPALKHAGIDHWTKLSRGAIVAVCELKDCRIIGQELNGDATIAADDMFSWTPILGNERTFGDYSPGRYAWLLSNVRALPEPIPAKGALGLWNYEGEL